MSIVDVQKFNETYPVGTPVKAFKENQCITTKTRTTAKIISGKPCVWVEGIPESLDLYKVVPESN